MGEISFLNFPTWTIAKVIVLFGLFIYIIFGLVVVRQVKLMTDTVSASGNGLIRFFSFVHLLFTIAVFLFALITL